MGFYPAAGMYSYTCDPKQHTYYSGTATVNQVRGTAIGRAVASLNLHACLNVCPRPFRAVGLKAWHGHCGIKHAPIFTPQMVAEGLGMSFRRITWPAADPSVRYGTWTKSECACASEMGASAFGRGADGLHAQITRRPLGLS